MLGAMLVTKFGCALRVIIVCVFFTIYCFKSSDCKVFVLGIFLFLIQSESSHNGSKVRRGPFPFIPDLLLDRGPKLHSTPVVQYGAPMNSATYEIE